MKRKLRTMLLVLLVLLMLPAAQLNALAESGGELVDVTLFMVSARKESPDSEITKQYIRDNLGINLVSKHFILQ